MHKHAFQPVEDEQPGLRVKLGEKILRQFGRPHLVQLLQRPAGHVGERATAEVRHDRASFVERIPKAPGPVGAHLDGVVVRPFPSKSALAIAANGVEQEEVRGICCLRPVVQVQQLRFAPDEFLRANVVRLGIEGGGLGDSLILFIFLPVATTKPAFEIGEGLNNLSSQFFF